MPVGSLSVRSPPAEKVDLWPEQAAADLEGLGEARCQLNGTRWGTHPDEQQGTDLPSTRVSSGSAEPLTNQGRSWAKADARGAAIIVSVTLLVLCVICVTLKNNPAGTEPFWQGLVKSANTQAVAQKTNTAQTKAQTLNDVVSALRKKLDHSQPQDAAAKASAGAKVARAAARHAALRDVSEILAAKPKKTWRAEQHSEQRINMVPLQPQTINVVPSSILDHAPRHSGKKSSFFLNW